MKLNLRFAILATLALNVGFPSVVYAAASIKSSNELREEIAQARERVVAIQTLATTENRDLSDDESKEIDNLIGVGESGASNHQPGRIAVLEAQLVRAEKLEKNQAELALLRARGNQHNPTTPNSGNESDDDEPSNALSRMTVRDIPVRMRSRQAKLVSFTGPNAAVEAYQAARFYAATIFGHQESISWCQDHGIDTRIHGAQLGGTDSAGGFLITSELERSIIDLREKRGIFRQEAQVVPMAGDTKDQPKRLTGVAAAWMGGSEAESEGADITESEKTWGNVQLVTNTMASMIKYSPQISDDAFISIADDLTKEIAYAFSDLEDRTGFLGDASDAYGGFTGVCRAMAAGAIYTTPVTKTKYDDLVLGDFQKPLSMLAEYADENVCWYINKKAWLAWCRIVEALGGNTGYDLATGTARVPQILGYRVRLTSIFPKTLGAQPGAFWGVVGDLRQGAMLGDRSGMTLFASAHLYMKSNMLAIRGTERCAVKVHEVGTSSEAGSLVALKMGAAS